MREFYCLGQPWLENPEYGTTDWFEKYGQAEWTDFNDFGTKICTKFPDEHQGTADRVGDLHVILPSKNVPDFLWTAFAECIITDDVRKLFQESRFTGFETRPVIVEKVKYVRKGTKPKIPTLWELIASGKGGNADPDSGIHPIEESRCDGCGFVAYSSYRNGIIVDEDEWDSSDFFTVNGYPAHILITESVKDTIVDNGLVNCSIINSRKLEWMGEKGPEDYYKSDADDADYREKLAKEFLEF